MNTFYLENKAVIFDLDGVLLDSAEYHYLAWKKIASELNIHFNRKINHLLRGVSRKESLLIMTHGKIELDEKQITEITTRKNALYLDFVRKAGEKLLFDGINDFLAELRKTPLKLAVSSGSRNAPELIDISGLKKDFFHAVVSGQDFTRSKPDPESFLMAAGKVGINAENCLVIEDAPAGIEAARRARMGTFGVGNAELGSCDIKAESLSLKNVSFIFEYFKNHEV
ncbi:MAG: beta-phosphoglucomutase [Lentisphaerae bacterium GWF2_45_14]|nr:MAG: beta-phosphoglucomutase [Lentisphaerae bacterium GWF2_45_14]